MDALPSELVKHILSFDLGTTFAVASRVNRTWKQLALSQLSSITSLTISYDSRAPMQHRRAKHPLAHRTAHVSASRSRSRCASSARNSWSVSTWPSEATGSGAGAGVT